MDIGELEKAKKIEQQVERWDLFAKTVPTIFLIGCFAFLAMGFSFEMMFTIGLGGFAITAVVWWFWAIFSIRLLVRILSRATENLFEVGNELKKVKKEYQELRNEENNHR